MSDQQEETEEGAREGVRNALLRGAYAAAKQGDLIAAAEAARAYVLLLALDADGLDGHRAREVLQAPRG